MSICTDLEKWPRDNDGCLINFHESTTRRVIDEIERLKAESEDYRQGFIRVGCENAKLQAVVDAVMEYDSNLIDSLMRNDALDTVDEQDTADGS